MVRYSYDLFTMISDYWSPIPKFNQGSLILLLIYSKKQNYQSVEELQKDYEQLHLYNDKVTPDFLMIFSEAMNYLLKNNIVNVSEQGLALDEEQCLLFLLDNTNTTQINLLN
ncbi:hypothetical protein PVA17_20280 [Lysinibacillus sp. CNPSo 3705]|uniref:hypothetical protein n=1 Tax=Lysinibacillus sp. CNPSo 3705 TaxID=3028148 RepID=UPI0023648699|nr:hypothetical protein [Lysinibacillus sp. CNPSo 3705]MDD1505083.1 hypothetical protein [Lysinibacillus sp. CNPSo 3705]